MMLTELCRECQNWFVAGKHSGTFAIEGGTLSADFLVPGQYFRIVGSIFNDGVHMYPAYDLFDETFTGEIWAMKVPQDFLRDAALISEWRAKYETVDSAALSPYNSESFGGYSYTKTVAGNEGSGSWQAVFKDVLKNWRKI